MSCRREQLTNHDRADIEEFPLGAGGQHFLVHRTALTYSIFDALTDSSNHLHAPRSAHAS